METVTQSPRDPGFVQNPYPFYRDCRARGDFVYWDDLGIPVATTHEAVTAVMKHRALGRAAPPGAGKDLTAMPAYAALEANSMLELDPPAHTRLRSLVTRAFTSKQIMLIAPEISAICDRLIDGLPTNFDLLPEYARIVPVVVIARLLGVPEEDAPRLLSWSNAMVAVYQVRRDDAVDAAAEAAAAEFTAYVGDCIERKRRAPGDDLISHLIAAKAHGERLTTDEMISTVILLLNAGHEATVHSIGNAARLLIGFPGRAEAVAPEQIAGTVEECLRFEPPLHLFRRHVNGDAEILGERFSSGDVVGCLLGSACRDDAVWPDADTFDPFRPVRTNTAFGAGIHFCVGAPLARLELQIALPVLFARCPGLRITETPRIADIWHFRGLESLHVACDRVLRAEASSST